MNRLDAPLSDAEIRHGLVASFYVNGAYNETTHACFGDQLSDAEAHRQVMIGFIKVVQTAILASQTGTFVPRVFIRHWKRSDTMLHSAFSIIVLNVLTDKANEAFKKAKRLSVSEARGVHYSAIPLLYVAMLANSDGEDDETRDVDADGVEFRDVFTWDRTRRHLLDTAEEEVQYVPLDDYEIMDAAHMFYWAAWEHTVFPWFKRNLYEAEASKIHAEIASQSLCMTRVQPSGIRINARFYESARADIPIGDDVDQGDLMDPAANEDEDMFIGDTRRGQDRPVFRVENEDDNDDDDDDNPLRNKKRKSHSYFSARVLLARMKRIMNKRNRVFSMSIEELGKDQLMKEPTTLLKRINENNNQRTLDRIASYMGDEPEEYARTQMQEAWTHNRRMLNDFTKCAPAYARMPTALKSILSHFLRKRMLIPFYIYVENGESGMQYGTLTSNYVDSRTAYISGIAGGGNTLYLQFLMELSRDSSMCLMDPLGICFFAYGPPGTGKSKAIFMVVERSIPGTIITMNQMQSAKATTAYINLSDMSMIVHTDASPYFSVDYNKMTVPEKERLKSLTAEQSDGETKYHTFFFKKGSNDDGASNRRDIVIQNSSTGSRGYLGNAPAKLREFRDRQLELLVEQDKRARWKGGLSVLGYRIAELLTAPNQRINGLKRLLDSISKNIQASAGLMFVAHRTSSIPGPTVLSATYLSAFILYHVVKRSMFSSSVARPFVMIMKAANTICATRATLLLTHMHGGKYFGRELVTDVGEFVWDMQKRMVVNYEDVVFGVSCVLPHILEQPKLDTLHMIWKGMGIIGIDDTVTYDLGTEDGLCLYFSNVMYHRRTNSVKITFPTTQSKFRPGASERRTASEGGDGGDGQAFPGSGSADFSKMESYIDFNYIAVYSERESIFTWLHGIVPQGCVDTQSILSTLKTMRDDLKISHQFRKYYPLTPNFDETVNMPILGSQNIRSYLGTRTADLPNQNHESVIKVIQHSAGYGSSRGFMIVFPINTIVASIKQGQPEDILRDVLTEDLPYQSQGGPITVRILDHKTCKTEEVVIAPHSESPDNFVILNPKKQTRAIRTRVKQWMEQYEDYLKDDDEPCLMNDLFSSEYIEIREPLMDCSWREHQKKMFLSASEMAELRSEEARLVDMQMRMRFGRE